MAFKSGLVKVGDLIHEVDGRNIHFLPPQEITQLIVGPPSSMVTLKISDGKNNEETKTSIGTQDTSYARIRAGDVLGVEEHLKNGSLHVNRVMDEPSGWRALHFSAADGHAQLVDLLLKYNADVNLQTVHGLSPAVLAHNNGHHLLADHLSRISPMAPGTALQEQEGGVTSVKKKTVHAPGTLGGFAHKSLTKSPALASSK